jgi:hypothetical protein
MLNDLRIARTDLPSPFFSIVLRVSLPLDLGEPFRMLFAINVWRHNPVPVVFMPNSPRMAKSQSASENFVRFPFR